MVVQVSKHRQKQRKSRRPVDTVGWREYVSLPELGVDRIKAKIDTGARSSALHAWNVVPFEKDGCPWVTFDVHPLQRNNKVILSCRAPLTTRRFVTSSSGHREIRFVVGTKLRIGTKNFPIELTLTNRDAMGFRLLLGRTAIRRKFLVNPSKSYLCPSSEIEKGADDANLADANLATGRKA